jgi:ABC-type metal ion transport system substrate-binding protein
MEELKRINNKYINDMKMEYQNNILFEKKEKQKLYYNIIELENKLY